MRWVSILRERTGRPARRARASRRQVAEEIEDRGIDLIGAFLPGQVAATGQHHLGVERGDELLEIRQQLVCAGESNRQVASPAMPRERSRLLRTG